MREWCFEKGGLTITAFEVDHTPVGVRPERAKQVIEHHVTPEQARVVFAKTRPRLAVYSHIVQPDASEQDLLPPTRRTYSGAVEVGEDLMVILVGEVVCRDARGGFAWDTK